MKAVKRKRASDDCDILFKCFTASCPTLNIQGYDVNLRVSTLVTFVDVSLGPAYTESQVTKPKVVLPGDFFYPFTLNSSKTSFMTPVVLFVCFLAAALNLLTLWANNYWPSRISFSLSCWQLLQLNLILLNKHFFKFTWRAPCMVLLIFLFEEFLRYCHVKVRWLSFNTFSRHKGM